MRVGLHKRGLCMGEGARGGALHEEGLCTRGLCTTGGALHEGELHEVGVVALALGPLHQSLAQGTTHMWRGISRRPRTRLRALL